MTGDESAIRVLERWQDNGAVWRSLHLSDELVIVELCTCHGEPVDRLESTDPETIEWVRARGAGGEPASSG
jgi:hypothetical protein